MYVYAKVKYIDDTDRSSRRDWNVGKHDEEVNKTRWSSVALKVKVAKDRFDNDGTWGKAKIELQKRFHFSRETVARWSRCAAGMDTGLLELLDTPHYERIKGTAVWDNPYLMGTGPSERKKLGLEYAKVALETLYDDPKTCGKTFEARVCAPLKILEVWDKLNRKRYGPVCENSSAYTRLRVWLMSPAGLFAIQQTIAGGIPLHGLGPDNPGIADCYSLVQEFQRCQAGGLPPPHRIPTTEELRKAAAEKAAEEQEIKDKDQAATTAAAMATLEEERNAQLEAMVLSTPLASSVSADAHDAEQSPARLRQVREAAGQKASDSDMRKVSFHDTPEALIAALAQPLQTVSRAILVIASPTSGWNGLKGYMDTAAEAIEKYRMGSGSQGGQTRFRILIFPGARVDVMAKVHEKARVVFPKMTVWTVTIIRGSMQTRYHRPSYAMIYANEDDDLNLLYN